MGIVIEVSQPELEKAKILIETLKPLCAQISESGEFLILKPRPGYLIKLVALLMKSEIQYRFATNQVDNE